MGSLHVRGAVFMAETDILPPIFSELIANADSLAELTPEIWDEFFGYT